MQEKLSKLLPYIIGLIILTMLLSLHFGLLDLFFFGAEHATVQGIDYFAVPKSFINLLEKRSIYDTWGGQSYGPYSTWYLAHPAFSVFVSSWFSFFSPWVSYWLFCIFSILVMGACGYFISKTTLDPFKKKLSYLFILCTFPTYWMLYVGNMHATLILALTLIIVGIYELTYCQNNKQANNKLLIGLLLSFFSKPIVLLMLPLLLIIKDTRKTTIKSLLIYGGVSLAFIFIPLFNPEAVGWEKLVGLDIDFIKQNLNIYKNNFVLNEYMKDNSIHWLNLIAQSDYKLIHIDVFSLPVFIDVIIGQETAPWIFKIPIYISLILSLAVGSIDDKKIRLETALLLIMAISLTFFLSYNTVWEYQFTSVLPILAMLPILRERNVFYAKHIPSMLIVGAFICLPSFYFLLGEVDITSRLALTIVHCNKIIPVLILFLLIIFLLIQAIRKHVDFRRLKMYKK